MFSAHAMFKTAIHTASNRARSGWYHVFTALCEQHGAERAALRTAVNLGHAGACQYQYPARIQTG